MNRIVGDGFDEPKRAEVEHIMQEIAERCLTLGINVILEFGFWAKVERDQMRALAAKVHAKVKLCYLAVSREELLRRLNKRNAERPRHTFVVSEQQLDSWISLFQAPSKDEIGL
jgi:predicted kinase